MMSAGYFASLCLIVVLATQVAEGEQKASLIEMSTDSVQQVDGADNLKAAASLADSHSVRKRRDEVQAVAGEKPEEVAPPSTTTAKPQKAQTRKGRKGSMRKGKGKGSKKRAKKRRSDSEKDVNELRAAPLEVEKSSVQTKPVNSPFEGLTKFEEMLAKSPWAEFIFGLDKKRQDFEHFVEAGKDLAGEVLEKLSKLPASTMRKVKNGIKEQIKAFEQKLDDNFGLAIPTTLFENGKEVSVAEAMVRSALSSDDESKRRAMDEESVVFEGKVPPKAIPSPKEIPPKKEPLLPLKPALPLIYGHLPAYGKVSCKVKFSVLKLFVETLHALTGLVLENELILADGSLLKLLGKIRPLLLTLKKVDSRAYI